MGCCYSVRCHFVYKDNDPSDFCNVIKEQREEQIKLMVKNSDSRIQNLDDPLNCFQILTGDVEEYENGIWESDFDASYSWGYVLEETFTEVLKVLECGSFVEIMVDDDQPLCLISLGDGEILSYFKTDSEVDIENDDGIFCVATDDEGNEYVKEVWTPESCYVLRKVD